MLHEKFLPEYHFAERHSIVISAPARVIFQYARLFSYADSWIIRTLMALRGIPKEAARGLTGLQKMGFVLLEERPGTEIILGLVGQFWKPAGNIQKVLPEEFKEIENPAFARTTWNVLIEESNGACLVTTETRIQCMSEKTRTSFGRYWKMIRPFSGWIRIEMLRSLKRQSESHQL